MFRPVGKKFSLQKIAEKLGCSFSGDGDCLLRGVAPLADAGSDELSFFSNSAYADALESSKAGAVIVRTGTDDGQGRNVIYSLDPYLAFARALKMFYTVSREFTGISEQSYISDDSTIAENVAVYDFVSIGEKTVIEEGVVIMSGCVIGDNVVIKKNSWLYPNVTVYSGVKIGSDVIIHSGAVIGSDGFGFAFNGSRHEKIPQVGGVVIEDDVEIGANVCIDRGALKDTVVRKNSKIDNLVQIAHNVEVGESSLLVSQSGISGSTRLGKGVIVAGQSGAVGHIVLGDGTKVGAKSAVTKSTTDGAFVTGFPAVEHRQWLKLQAHINKLPEMTRKIKELEAIIKELKKT